MTTPMKEGFRRLNCAPAPERFLTCRLVATMLEAAGQVSADGHTFIADTCDELLLECLQELPPAEIARMRGAAQMRTPGQPPLLAIEQGW